MHLSHMCAAGLVIASALGAIASTHSSDDVAAIIKRQSQEFSDASASGDSATFARLLDDSVIFMNETGAIATKKDILSGGKPPAGMTNKLVQTDYQMQLHGNVAVTSFTDNSTVTFATGQTTHAKYRSTEVWMSEKGGWKMISSQTLTMADDPPAAKLAANVLDQYVGTYKAGDSFTFKIARSGDGLTGSLNGAAPYAIDAELTDVLFTPGQPNMRRIFERDAAGTITGFIVRRDGRDVLHLTRVG